MKANLQPRPRFLLWLTEAEIATLVTCSKLHYDGKCKFASYTGGFLHGWSNWAVMGAPHENGLVYCPASNEEVDTCLKILEMPRPEEEVVARALSIQLRHCFHEAARIFATLSWELIP
jgi:hypothetical protein